MELRGNSLKMYQTREYILYIEKAVRHELAEGAGIVEYFPLVAVEIGNNVFARLNGVNPADLQKSDLVHNIYLGLFKTMTEWVEGFLKKHNRQQALDHPWKEIPPYPGLHVPKKAYRQVRQ